MTDPKPLQRKSSGRPVKTGPRAQRKAITLYGEEWDQLDAIEGANRSDKIRHLLREAIKQLASLTPHAKE